MIRTLITAAAALAIFAAGSAISISASAGGGAPPNSKGKMASNSSQRIGKTARGGANELTEFSSSSARSHTRSSPGR